jgi:hypothetical protein
VEQEEDILARIAELRSVLRGTRSEDVRQTIVLAIESWESRLAELRRPLENPPVGPTPLSCDAHS